MSVVCVGAAHRRQQRQLPPFASKPHRYRRHSRTRRPCRSSSNSMVSTLRPGISRSTCSTGFECAERFLVAVAVHQRLVGDGAERQTQAAGLGLADQKFLEQQCMRADALRGIVVAQRQQFVAQRQQATRLKADDRHAARGERRIGCHQPIEFGAGIVDQSRREEGAPAAQRALLHRQVSADARDSRPRPARAARRRGFRAHRRD